MKRTFQRDSIKQATQRLKIIKKKTFLDAQTTTCEKHANNKDLRMRTKVGKKKSSVARENLSGKFLIKETFLSQEKRKTFRPRKIIKLSERSWKLSVFSWISDSLEQENQKEIWKEKSFFIRKFQSPKEKKNRWKFLKNFEKNWKFVFFYYEFVVKNNNICEVLKEKKQKGKTQSENQKKNFSLEFFDFVAWQIQSNPQFISIKVSNKTYLG